LGAFSFWAYTPLGPISEALAALESDEQVIVNQINGLLYTLLKKKNQ
jgi:hypothetical protein